MRVEFVGGPGIGKTSLCRSLEIIGFNCIFEATSVNPFRVPGADESLFPALMWDLLGKFHDIQTRQRPDLLNIVDQGLMNVRAAARLGFGNEDREGQAIFMQAFDYLEAQIGAPDLIVHLKCSPSELMRRIRSRGRPEDEHVSIGAIAELQHEIAQMTTRARIDGQPVLTVDTDEISLVGNLPYAEKLARLIAGMVYQQGEPRAPRVRNLPANDKTPLLQYVEMAEAM
jgi:deoxyadenosine/deoxycytidine kinase